jgi:phosphatidate cytidylyltransferase
VLSGSFDWRSAFLAVSISALALVIAQVIEGRRDIKRAAQDGERFVSAYLLVSICASQLVILSSASMGIHFVWWIVAVVALNDAAAYFVGRSLGRTKMAPALSPNKTIEGSIAGLLVGAGAGWLFWQLIITIPMPGVEVVVLALCMTIAAQAADLSKSYLKRLRGVKDTGSFFPGHGGVLDRFDGLIGASPVVLVFLVWAGLLS